jgi:hypothetical protein
MPRAAALAVTLLVLAACTAVPEVVSPPATVPPTLTPTPSPAPPPSPSPSASPAEAVETLPAIEEIAAEVGALRDLPVGGPVGARVVSPEELGALLVEQDEEARAEEGGLSDEDALRVLTALRLVPEGTDLAAVRDLFLRQGVSGVYVPEDDILYVASTAAELTPASAVTAAHEVTHTLQDRAFDLDRDDPVLDDDSDAALAFTALVEGDAVFTQEEWSLEEQTAEERRGRDLEADRQAAADAGALDAVPAYILDGLTFPYSDGLAFVVALRRAGGDAAVDAALRDPPRSTAEILAPQRFLDGFTPDPPAPPAAPPGWNELDRDTLGVVDLAWLTTREDGGVGEARTALAQTWQGGTLRVWTRGDELAVGAAVTMTTPAAAAGVCEDLADGRLAGTVAVACDGAEARFAVADDPTVADGLITTR